MSLSAVLAALLWSHYHPHGGDAPETWVRRFHGWLLDNFNAGESRHGHLAWAAGVLFPALALALLAALLEGLAELLGWAFQVAVLYACLGFRADSFRAAAVARALEAGNPDQARQALESWRPAATPGCDGDGLARLTVEELLRAGLSHLLGVLFWFFLFGVFGAVAYRLAHLARQRWHAEAEFGDFAARAGHFLDWPVVRAGAFSFAIVGNFQDALECWRAQAHTWGDVHQGVLLAAGAGALGVRLGGDVSVPGGVLARPSLGIDEAAGPETAAAATALLWRTVILWLAVAGLLWLGGL